MPNDAYGPTVPRGETFSYLPPMTPERLHQQIAYLIERGWNPAVEYSEPEKARSNFWYLWKLPLFGEKSVERVLAELDACRRAYPNHLVRLIGYDNFTQSQGTAFIVHRAGAR
ncbi:MAG: ribulose bisphosphate carboxylase small subunit [Actinobacteria bacterium]|nr:ribulose bisphosphate carboxylase small subunit [Actinomycetota bacterium]